MSAYPSPSPPQRPFAMVEDSQWPQGQCHFILLQPEVKGQRCACVGFSRKATLPGATCACGHLACYHEREVALPSTTRVGAAEFGLLNSKIQLLEEQVVRGWSGARILARVSELEDLLDKRSVEFEQRVRGIYQHVNMVYHANDKLRQRAQVYDQQFRRIYMDIDHHGTRIQDLQDRLLELQDADELLEERFDGILDQLDSQDMLTSRPTGKRTRRMSTTDLLRLKKARSRVDSPPCSSTLDALASVQPMSCSAIDSMTARTTTAVAVLTVPSDGLGPTPTVDSTMVAGLSPAPDTLWTVHVSFLPDASIPMPFERGTNAYQRCLSRGLHQMVAVDGPSGEAFAHAISRAFGGILDGRAWMPLQTRICNACKLEGLSMLRPLDADLMDKQWDFDFLRKYCGVCDANGRLDSLYIALRKETLSWSFLRRAPAYLEGLEACWLYDHRLDGNDPWEQGPTTPSDDNQRPTMGDKVIVTASLKRSASEISLSHNNTVTHCSSSDGDGPRVKRSRPSSAPELAVGLRTERVRTI